MIFMIEPTDWINLYVSICYMYSIIYFQYITISYESYIYIYVHINMIMYYIFLVIYVYKICEPGHSTSQTSHLHRQSPVTRCSQMLQITHKWEARPPKCRKQRANARFGNISNISIQHILPKTCLCTAYCLPHACLTTLCMPAFILHMCYF